ncbi:hypothetical protein TNCT_301481 [Trichonephila clavata]|uniref:Uncharacterized protein n=1 Tax=Trichonephila clavata TaxID=2740835 RepID=A0A8X6L854_TRICU|nr:hypothetical protein TNCT_301481 [Trichonephila clavata]
MGGMNATIPTDIIRGKWALDDGIELQGYRDVSVAAEVVRPGWHCFESTTVKNSSNDNSGIDNPLVWEIAFQKASLYEVSFSKEL